MPFWAQAGPLIDGAVREIALFSAVGFLAGGLDDLIVDSLYVLRRFLRPGTQRSLADFPVRPDTDFFAIFVPAWREADVIGPMLRNALARLTGPDFRIYVGTYPNDGATIATVLDIAGRNPRVRLIVGDRPGPTTKGDNLNTMYRILLQDEMLEGRRARAIVLHDAEDVVHPGELQVFDHLLDDHWVAQIPVLPLIAGHGLISGHYADEFAESHAKLMVVREAVGAALPLAGVGCAIRRDALDAVALTRDNGPFDGGSLTEDYEFGLHVASLGGSGVFARVAERPGGPPVAVRAYFPRTIGAAIRQKARWTNGIALAGWDRTGWARAGAFADHWMRMRDRRAPLAALVTLASYLAISGAMLSAALHFAKADSAPAFPPVLHVLLLLNIPLLLWRLSVRGLFTWSAYGWRQAALSAPRMAVGNVIALLAAARATGAYCRSLLGAAPRWDKTEHDFPDAATLLLQS